MNDNEKSMFNGNDFVMLSVLGSCYNTNDKFELNGSVWELTEIFEDGKSVEFSWQGKVYLEFSKTFVVATGNSIQISSYIYEDDKVIIKNQNGSQEYEINSTKDELKYQYSEDSYAVYKRVDI